MERFTTGDIIPGERIGIFHLGMPWQAVQPLLPTYEREQRHGCFVIKTPALWFFIDEPSELLTQVIALDRFQGAFLGQIRVGSTLGAIEAICGRCCSNDNDGWEVPAYPGISFYQIAGRDGIAYIAVHSRDST
jgi:hypothetical protein